MTCPIANDEEKMSNPNEHASPNFTDAEWANLRAEDYAGGKAVVMLMLGIFLTGVVLYSIVAFFVIS
jgi:hypothetical protein